jgi:hypothetical protein
MIDVTQKDKWKCQYDKKNQWLVKMAKTLLTKMLRFFFLIF